MSKHRRMNTLMPPGIPAQANLASCHVEPSLRVVVIGDAADSNVCDVYRTRMYLEPLRRLGIDVRYAPARIGMDGPLGLHEIDRQIADGTDRLWAELESADVVVFRRVYGTHALCGGCGYATLDIRAAAEHGRASGHALEIGSNVAVRSLFDRLEHDPRMAGRLGIIYETDDDLLRVQPSNGHYRVVRHEIPLLERMIARADLVTVSTPVLAGGLARLSDHVTLVRNAIDPSWYSAGAAPHVGDTRARVIAYYGSLARLRDYRLVAPAVDAVASRTGMIRAWIGAPAMPAEVERVRGQFDEIYPFVVGVPSFARSLAALGPSIGVAPLPDDGYARSKSELHWLEYTMAGAVTVATRLAGGGPYDVIRHGTDGILVGSRGWNHELSRVAGSPSLREALVGVARQRILGAYTVDVRATEWASAYRSAAASSGRGLRGVMPVGTVPARRLAGGRKSDRRKLRTLDDSPLLGAAEVQPVGRGKVQPRVASPIAGILAAYVAAQAYAGLRPLRVRLGVAGSTAERHTTLDGWVTIDSEGQPDIRHDVGLGLPFGDGTVEAIEALAVVEWLGSRAPILATEAFRVLCPGGVMQILTPDRAAALARKRQLEAQAVVLAGELGRLPPYTAESLDRLLRQAGFTDVRVERTERSELLATATRRAAP